MDCVVTTFLKYLEDSSKRLEQGIILRASKTGRKELTSEDKDYKKGQIPQYVYIEGVRYNKKNLEEISNKVLEICNLRPKKKNK